MSLFYYIAGDFNSEVNGSATFYANSVLEDFSYSLLDDLL